MRKGLSQRNVAVVVAAAVMLLASAPVVHGESLHSLQSAEQAFYKAGLPFEFDWTPNPYLRPNPKTGGAAPGPTGKADPVTPVPTQLIGNLKGWAGGSNALTFKVWTISVFDRASAAAAYAHLATATKFLVLRTNNTVYVGSGFPAASRAMAQLSHQ